VSPYYTWIAFTTHTPYTLCSRTYFSIFFYLLFFFIFWPFPQIYCDFLSSFFVCYSFCKFIKQCSRCCREFFGFYFIESTSLLFFYIFIPCCPMLPWIFVYFIEHLAFILNVAVNFSGFTLYRASVLSIYFIPWLETPDFNYLIFFYLLYMLIAKTQRKMKNTTLLQLFIIYMRKNN
jgi:hypothetical protein